MPSQPAGQSAGQRGSSRPRFSALPSTSNLTISGYDPCTDCCGLQSGKGAHLQSRCRRPTQPQEPRSRHLDHPSRPHCIPSQKTAITLPYLQSHQHAIASQLTAPEGPLRRCAPGALCRTTPTTHSPQGAHPHSDHTAAETLAPTSTLLPARTARTAKPAPARQAASGACSHSAPLPWGGCRTLVRRRRCMHDVNVQRHLASRADAGIAGAAR